MNSSFPLERHPWPPFVPSGATVLMLGTFPPKPERWSMPFYYPNKINDMWRIMGLIFYGDRDHFYDSQGGVFRQEQIMAFLTGQGIAMWDTAMSVRRLRDNASDKFLEIVEQIDLSALLDTCPTIRAVVTAGVKATQVIAGQVGCALPMTGCCQSGRVGRHVIDLWRMPSTSRAYPMGIEQKASAYRHMFAQVGILGDSCC